MNRRLFLKISSLSLLPLINKACTSNYFPEYNFSIHNDMTIGHLVHEGHNYSQDDNLNTDILIVGGGLAGLSAAHRLRNRDYLVIELSDRPGGTSGAEIHNGLEMAQGAHYDLAYPSYYGEEAIKMLEDLDIIKFNAFSKLYDFTDTRYLIDPRHKENCFSNGEFTEDVLPEGPGRDQLIDALNKYAGKMPMPTRLIGKEFRHLNNISFIDFLQQKMDIAKDLKTGLDYNMRDDYGASSDRVSALAGIHYFQCRPYFTQPVPLFSPPEGNYYFVKKIAESLDENRILLQHLGINIQKSGNKFITRVLDAANKRSRTITSDKIIYAGQKHVLQYVFPTDYSLFESNEYAPWLIVNLVLKKRQNDPPFWQNEMPGRHPHMLGFVDASAQHKSNESSQTFITMYYNLKPEERNLLSEIEFAADGIVDNTVKHASAYFGKDITPEVDKAYIKVMGHAMPIPVPGYLFNDRNQYRNEQNLVYAGVDNGRLPLLFEAIDSGIVAAELVR